MKNLFHRVLVPEYDGRALEVQNSCISVMVGAVFLYSYVDGHSIYLLRPEVYRYLAWAGPWFWGSVMSTAGALHLYSVVGNRRWLRKQILLIKAGLWINLTVCVLMASVHSIIGWVFLVLGLSAIRCYLKIRTSEKNPALSTSKAPNVRL